TAREDLFALRGFQSRQNLTQNAQALTHLEDTYIVAIVNITVLPGRDVEVQFRIDAIRVSAAHVIRYTTGTQQRTRAAIGNRHIRRQHTDTDGTRTQDLVVVEIR